MVVKDCIFCLIQTYFAFSSFTTLPEFEVVRVRHGVVLALVVICDCLSQHYCVWYCQRSAFWLHVSTSPRLFLKIQRFCSMFPIWILWLSNQVSLWAPFSDKPLCSAVQVVSFHSTVGNFFQMPLSNLVTDVTVFSGIQKPNTKHLYKGAQGSSLTSCFKVCQEASDSPLLSARRNSSVQLESGKSTGRVSC